MKFMKKAFDILLSVGIVLIFYSIAINHAWAQSCVQPPSGLTGWWPGDGNTEDIVGGRDAVLKGDTTFDTGQVSMAFILDGDGDYVDVPHDEALNVGTGDFTVDLWVKFNTTEGEQLLVEKYSEDFSAQPRGWFLTKLQENVLRFGTGQGDYAVDSGILNFPSNTWIHFAARRASGLGSIFVNGVQVADGQLNYDADSESSLKFGHRGSPDDDPPTPGSTDKRGFFLKGVIDEVELFVGRALSDQEVLAIYNAGVYGKCKQTTPEEPSVEETIDFFEQAVEDGTLEGKPGLFGSWFSQYKIDRIRRYLDSASNLIEGGRINAACRELRRAYEGCDGVGYDLVIGEDADNLNQMIYDLSVSLGCRWTAD